MDFLRKLARKINGNPISRNLVLAACAIIVFMCVVNLLLNLFTRHGQVRDVPDFSGMSIFGHFRPHCMNAGCKTALTPPPAEFGSSPEKKEGMQYFALR